MNYPNAAGPIWIPTLTPEGSPKSTDEWNIPDRELGKIEEL
jgi:hypothetical protein